MDTSHATSAWHCGTHPVAAAARGLVGRIKGECLFIGGVRPREVATRLQDLAAFAISGRRGFAIWDSPDQLIEIGRGALHVALHQIDRAALDIALRAKGLDANGL